MNDEAYFRDNLQRAREESGTYIKGLRSGAIEDNPELAIPRPTNGTLGPENPFMPSFDERTKISETMVARKKMEDAPLREILKQLIERTPDNYRDLIQLLESMNVRKDLVKELLETKKEKLFSNLQSAALDFSPEMSAEINKQVYGYLGIISTLVDMGYNLDVPKLFGKKTWEYDPYHAELGLDEISTAMFKRRKNGCSVEIPIPKTYDYNSPQSGIDAVVAIVLIDQEIEGNKASWGYYGYKAPNSKKQEEALEHFNLVREREQALDSFNRHQLIVDSKNEGLNVNIGGIAK